MTESLYIHIPFCSHICNYCDFPKVLSGSFSEDKYISCLLDELKSYHIKDDSLKTIYIGGGTPSSLSVESLTRLLSYLHEHFKNVIEFSMEANPESLTEDKIQLLKKYGVNRISLGVESSRDHILKILNRKHTVAQVESVIRLLRQYNFDNINLDFIYGVSEMTSKDLDHDIAFALKQNVEHLSFYSLQIEEGTVFYINKVKAKSDDRMSEMYEKILVNLENHGYHRYEVSNFSNTGKESLHNLTYWHDKEYFACGLGASGYVNDIRYKNTLSMNKYLAGNYRHEEEKISIYDHEFEYLMLHLRLIEGFSLDEFETLFHKNFLSSYKENIAEIKDYVSVRNGRFSIKKKYIYTMDQILLSLLKLPEDIEKE